MNVSRSYHLLVLFALVAGSCGPATTVNQPAPPQTSLVRLDATARRHAGVSVAPVEIVSRVQETEAPGVLTLDEKRTARIGSFVEGILTETFADVGDRVSAGQVLATMHSTLVHEAWAAYRKAIADRRRLEKEVAYASAAFDRTQRLYAEKAISLQEVQRAESDRVAAEENLDVGRTEVRRSEEELEHLGITNAEDPTGENGELIPVKTPTSGVILERLVTPGTAVTPGTPLYVVSDLSTLWVLLEIDESLLPQIAVGQPIALQVAAYPGENFDGIVALVGDSVNPKTHRVTVRSVIKNLDGRLKSQMYATALIREKESRKAMVVPADAIQTINGSSSVFVVEGDQAFRARAVQTGSTLRGKVEILSGLQAGEQIAVAGTFILKSELLKSSASEE